MVQAKVSHITTDNTITLTWGSKTRIEPQAVVEAFEFLDKQVADGEWKLNFEQIYFPTGKAFLQWQVETSTKIEPSQVSQ